MTLHQHFFQKKCFSVIFKKTTTIVEFDSHIHEAFPESIECTHFKKNNNNYIVRTIIKKKFPDSGECTHVKKQQQFYSQDNQRKFLIQVNALMLKNNNKNADMTTDYALCNAF